MAGQDARAQRQWAFQHAVNRALHEEAPLGARIANRVTAFMGSWTFIALQTAIVVGWIGGNVYLLFNFDPTPSSSGTSPSRPRPPAPRR